MGEQRLNDSERGDMIMLAMTLIGLFVVAGVGTGLSLVDSWMRGRAVYRSLKREQALLDAGFVPQLYAQDMRLRAAPRRTVASATRPYSRRRLPLPDVKCAS